MDEFNVKRTIYVMVSVSILFLMVFGYFVYTRFRIDVPAKHIAVLTRKTGDNLENGEEVAPDVKHKGLQLDVLSEGRYFKNCYTWDWAVYPMVEVPEGKMGVRIRLYGEDLPYGHFVAISDNQKGIVKEVLKPGRYALNAIVKDGDKDLSPRDRSDYTEIVELHDPVTISAGFKGVVTNLAGPLPEEPNILLVAAGFRGVQEETLDPGTYYLNPYMFRIDAIDCRSQRFNLSEGEDMSFPSKDGFPILLDGIIEFRVNPTKAAEVYVIYNEYTNDKETGNVDWGSATIDEEIIKKIILPNARAFCRLEGSNSSGREFIGGETRTSFQLAFESDIRETCSEQGIEIIQALITRIRPPEAIAGPVRDREVANQMLKQYQQQEAQQQAEAQLAVEKALITQKTTLVEADRDVVQMTVRAEQDRDVAVLKASELLEVSKQDLAAAIDTAEAILAKKKAEAEIIEFENQALAAGWKRSVEALGGDGETYARYVLYQKMAPSFRSIMTNTADSPLMQVFNNFAEPDILGPKTLPASASTQAN